METRAPRACALQPEKPEQYEAQALPLEKAHAAAKTSTAINKVIFKKKQAWKFLRHQIYFP